MHAQNVETLRATSHSDSARQRLYQKKAAASGVLLKKRWKNVRNHDTDESRRKAFNLLRKVPVVFGVLLVLFFANRISVSVEARATAQQPHDYNEEQDQLVDDAEEDVRAVAKSEPYDPNARDFTARCLSMAEFSGPNTCKVFMKCCSEENVLNRLNGDRCQRAHQDNGCQIEGSDVRWSLCRAYNCTAEITTTTTTTTLNPRVASAATLSVSVPARTYFLLAEILIFAALPYSLYGFGKY